jgi:hypothetical protein
MSVRQVRSSLSRGLSSGSTALPGPIASGSSIILMPQRAGIHLTHTSRLAAAGALAGLLGGMLGWGAALTISAPWPIWLSAAIGSLLMLCVGIAGLSRRGSSRRQATIIEDGRTAG